MPKRMIISLFLLAAVIGPAAAQNAQQRGGIRTETQERLANQGGLDLIWNLIGLAGLLGLLGLRQEHPDDSYHPTSIE